MSIVLPFDMKRAIPITPSDTVDLDPPMSALYVGGTGDVKLRTWDGSDVTFQSVPAGGIIPMRVRRVWAAGTTATKIMGMA